MGRKVMGEKLRCVDGVVGDARMERRGTEKTMERDGKQTRVNGPKRINHRVSTMTQGD